MKFKFVAHAGLINQILFPPNSWHAGLVLEGLLYLCLELGDGAKVIATARALIVFVSVRTEDFCFQVLMTRQ